MTWKTPTITNGAVCWAILGLGLATLLLISGRSGREAAEGAALVAGIIGTPISIPLMAIEWFTRLSSWVFFVLLVVPTNGALVGALAAGGARLVKWHNPAWLIAIPSIWFAIFMITVAWLTTPWVTTH